MVLYSTHKICILHTSNKRLNERFEFILGDAWMKAEKKTIPARSARAEALRE